MQTLFQDIRFALRTFAKRPGFVAVAVITLALGIGANSAIFSVINGVLLKPLPFTEPDNVVKLWEAKAGGFQGTISVPNLKDWREQNSVFTKIAAYQFENFGLQSSETPERVRATTVSPDFFDVLGVAPQLGRVIAAGEDQPGKNRVAVLTHQLWQNKFAADPGIVGKPIRLGGENFTVIGVMPASLRYPSRTADLWIPLTVSPQQMNQRGSHFLFGLARLKPGVTLAQAQEQMNIIARRLEQQYPDQQAGRSVLVIQAQEEIVRFVRPALLVLMTAVGFVLLIACTNVANLLRARAATRRREIAIRNALGAGRGRLIRQLLTESVMLSALGGALGIAVAYASIGALTSWAATILPRASEVALDSRVVLFTIVLALLTGIVFGLAPAWQSSKTDIQKELKEGGATAGGPQRNWLRSLLVIGEVAAALILLIGASLLIRSFGALQQTATGLKADNILTMGISLPASKYSTPEAMTTFYQQTLEKVSALPGVQSAGVISKLPIQEYGYNSGIQIEGQPPLPPDREIYTELRAVSPDYFRTFGIPLIAGRLIDERDQANAPLVVVVNETFVKQIVNDHNAVGKFIPRGDNLKFQIVGVVGDVRQSGLIQNTRPEVYWPYSQVPDSGLKSSMSLVVRAATDPAAMTAAVRNAVLAVDPAQPVHNIKTMEAVIDDSISDRRLNMLLLTIFAGVALTLAIIGVYSVMSYLVAQHTREIGIRIALGARGVDVLKLVVGQGLVLTSIGIGIGIAAAYALTHLMASLLFGVSATDPIVFIVSPLILLLIALLACYVPARRATRVDPMVALRYE